MPDERAPCAEGLCANSAGGVAVGNGATKPQLHLGALRTSGPGGDSDGDLQVLRWLRIMDVASVFSQVYVLCKLLAALFVGERNRLFCRHANKDSHEINVWLSRQALRAPLFSMHPTTYGGVGLRYLAMPINGTSICVMLCYSLV